MPVLERRATCSTCSAPGGGGRCCCHKYLGSRRTGACGFASRPGDHVCRSGIRLLLADHRSRSDAQPSRNGDCRRPPFRRLVLSRSRRLAGTRLGSRCGRPQTWVPILGERRTSCFPRSLVKRRQTTPRTSYLFSEASDDASRRGNGASYGARMYRQPYCNSDILHSSMLLPRDASSRRPPGLDPKPYDGPPARDELSAAIDLSNNWRDPGLTTRIRPFEEPARHLLSASTAFDSAGSSTAPTRTSEAFSDHEPSIS